jgi:hypothetical protein
VFFYDRRQVERSLQAAGWEDVRVTRLSRDYLVDARSRGEEADNPAGTAVRT